MQRAVIISLLGLYLVFNVTAVYEKPCNRTEKEALKTALLCGVWQVAQNRSNRYPKLQEIIGRFVVNIPPCSGREVFVLSRAL